MISLVIQNKIVNTDLYSMHIHQIMRRRMRSLRLFILVTVFVSGYLILILPTMVWNSYPNDLTQESHTFRKLLATNDSDDDNSGVYPPDAFTLEQRRKGAVTLHVFGMIYMFVALAIVCDEFFVPALGVIIEKLDISEDVAGATFMAAGGSAPELFTSLFGVFLAKSNVGIGTIVGSAVFNILFVIGMCAIFSKTVLDLTWWPLFRDVSFYSIGLILLIVFFMGGKIYWYYSLVLFLIYILYVIFMHFNAKIEKWVKSKLERFSKKSKVGSTDDLIEKRRRPHRSCSIPILHSGTSKFRHGVLQLMIHTIDPLAEHDHVHDKALRLHAVATLNVVLNTQGQESPAGHAYAPSQNGILRIGDNSSDNKQMQVHAISNGQVSTSSPTDSFTSGNTSMTVVNSSRTSPNVNSAQNSPATRRPLISPKQTPSKSKRDVNRNSTNNAEITHLGSDEVQRNGRAEPHVHFKTQQSSTTIDVDNNQTSETEKESSTEDAGFDDESEPLDMSWPDTWKRRIMYVFVAPLIFPMWLTLPDTRREEKKKYYPVTFLGSIVWIAIFTYLMVWWANQTGETIGIPNVVMGLTILAAGTSIPDLITSVIVAKKGFGDMAVSSSIGSNIFDITVGLPVPWLLYSAIFSGQAVDVDSAGLSCSITMLFGMLLAVIITIAASKWKMSKILGGVMLFLYCVFEVISVLLGLGKLDCII